MMLITTSTSHPPGQYADILKEDHNRFVELVGEQNVNFNEIASYHIFVT